MRKILYVLLTIFSGYIELGGVLYALLTGYSPLMTIGIVLAFQIGNIVPIPLSLNKFYTYLVLIAGVWSFSIVQFFNGGYWYIVVGVALLSSGTLSIRVNYAKKTGTTIKRLSRVSGFMLAPLFYIPAILVTVIILFFFMVLLTSEESRLGFIKPKMNYFNIIMIIHQMHYFCYTYFIIIILYDRMNFKAVNISLFFVLGWITYILIGHFLRGFSFRKYFILGHMGLFAILGIMYFNISNNLTVILWICTGLGAGTIFALSEINKQHTPYDKNAMDFAENSGHILGIVLSMILYGISKNIYLPIGGAAFLALLAAMMLFLKKQDISKCHSNVSYSVNN